MDKFEHFTDDELSVLQFQGIESHWEICSSGGYSEYFVKLHGKLMDEIIEEIKRRKQKKEHFMNRREGVGVRVDITLRETKL
jgi:hypothetical protein